jgi:hypothetical protein
VNELGEWKRWFNNAWQGMPSPILQAQRQGKFLRDYLESHVETLLNKLLLGRQAHFTKMPIDVLVAISDSGIINRPKNDKLNTVCKADQIASKVREIVSEYRKIDSLLSFSLKSAYLFDMDEVPRISGFLLANHKELSVRTSLTDVNSTPINSAPISPPIKPTAKPASPQKKIIPVAPVVASNIDRPKPNAIDKPVIKAVKTTTNTCSNCQSPNLAIAYVHSYFFKCNDCGKNTAIKNICPSCSDREKIRKSSLEFFTECEKCNTSRLFHTNS